MFEAFHKLFAYTIVFTVGLIVSLVEVPIKAILFWVALILYIAISFTAPLWVTCDTENIANFIKSSLKLKLRWTKKAMRAYRDALI